MPRLARLTVPLLALLAACSGASTTAPVAEQASARPPSGPADPAATWKLPLSDAGLAFRSDGRYDDGIYSVYANGVCGVSAKLFATTQYSNSGDATIQTTEARGRNGCGRQFTLSYPDSYTESGIAFNNLPQLQNTGFSIPQGSTVLRRLTLNLGTRCGRLFFGPNGTAGAGSDSVWVNRVDASTWHVYSQSSANLALCDNDGQLYAMPVDFVIVSSAPLP
jgi:hypothetical protein